MDWVFQYNVQEVEVDSAIKVELLVLLQDGALLRTAMNGQYLTPHGFSLRVVIAKLEDGTSSASVMEQKN
jgi:hypothetical protein